MPKCLNDPTRNYTGNEPSPKGLGYCAHNQKIGLIKKGKDGNNWEVKKIQNGGKRWVKISNKDMVNIYNPFIENIVVPILVNYEPGEIDFKKGDMISIKYEYDSINEDGFKVLEVKKKNNNLELVAEFKPTKEQIKNKEIRHTYDLIVDKDWWMKKGKMKKTTNELHLPIIIKSKDKATIKIKIDDISNTPFQFEIIESKYFNEEYEKYQNHKCKNYLESGIIFTKLNDKIIDKVSKEVKDFSSKSRKDYHPFSNKKVRDLIHPSLFPYVKGISKFNKHYNYEKESLNSSTEEVDFWNRNYEKSKFQWLPSEFEINSMGKCEITSYINNLPDKFTELRNSIELLFEKVLPQFEKVWSYIKTIKLYDNEEIDLYNKKDKLCINDEITQISLKNRTLQVITKIVTYDLNDEEMEGAWHVEGMSHENIVATAVVVLEQEDNFEAELLFKRRFTLCESTMIFNSTGQDRPDFMNIYLEGHSRDKNSKLLSGLIPLCKISTQKGSLTVFPNSHIHKLNTKNSSKKAKKRTVIVFWLINPDKRVISTKHIDPQQNKIKLKEAEKYRIELMEERKYHKQSFNVRDLNLCEH